MPKQPARQTQNDLQRALGVLKSRGRTNQEVAASAGISTRTLQQVLRGDFATDPSPADVACPPKVLRGYAESLTRLSIYCGLNPKDVLPGYGISLSLPEVSAAMERVRIRSV